MTYSPTFCTALATPDPPGIPPAPAVAQIDVNKAGMAASNTITEGCGRRVRNPTIYEEEERWGGRRRMIVQGAGGGGT
eukprot:1421367-Rhodomonas_salina.1